MKLLLAEDETDLSRALQALLTHSGYDVDIAKDGIEAVELAQKSAYDAIVLDIMMPRLDGMGALRQIRDLGDTTPVLFLTAKSELDDKISGLDAGADDYLTKPFAMGELLARIRSMTRRHTEFSPRVIELGGVTLNTENAELSSTNTIRLAARESRLMEMLMLHPGKPFSASALLERIWGDEPGIDQKVVWMYISFLRSKLQSIGAAVRIDGEQEGDYTLIID